MSLEHRQPFHGEARCPVSSSSCCRHPLPLAPLGFDAWWAPGLVCPQQRYCPHFVVDACNKKAAKSVCAFMPGHKHMTRDWHEGNFLVHISKSTGNIHVFNTAAVNSDDRIPVWYKTSNSLASNWRHSNINTYCKFTSFHKFRKNWTLKAEGQFFKRWLKVIFPHKYQTCNLRANFSVITLNTESKLHQLCMSIYHLPGCHVKRVSKKSCLQNEVRCKTKKTSHFPYTDVIQQPTPVWIHSTQILPWKVH